jgi:3-deoxy-manno-octulosonate cytidylyltransferase (CMP-KDO synthetase)
MIIGVIPARFASTRFPGKPLVEILGKTMIRRVYEQAVKCDQLNRVVVATDDDRIASEVHSFGGEFVMTSSLHPSGTDRCAETARILDLSDTDVIINIQGDEPFIDPGQIATLCSCFEDEKVELATLVKSFRQAEDVHRDSSIKVVLDKQQYALYFSRAVIPFAREFPADGEIPLETYVQHIGIYGYRASTLQKIAQLPPSFLENTEKLEQLRWLENGYRILTARSEHESFSVDTPEDLIKISSHFSGE